MFKTIAVCLGLLSSLSRNCVAQPGGSFLSRLSLGATGGVTLTEPSGFATVTVPGEVTTRFESRRYTLGPAVEFAVTEHIAIQFNPLYKRLGHTSIVVLGSTLLVSRVSLRVRQNAWEFPIVGKYYFGRRNRPWRAFAGAGYVRETAWQRRDSTVTLIDLATGTAVLTFPPITLEERTRPGAGAVVSGGLVYRIGRLNIAPELRYTRWNGRNHLDLLLTLRF